MKKILLILCTLTLGHLAMAQAGQQWLQKRVSISVQDQPVKQVLLGLERDLDGMVFAYSPGTFDMDRKISVKLDSVALEQVLHEVFTNQQLECTEMSGKIFLKKKKISDGRGGEPRQQHRRRRSYMRTPASKSKTIEAQEAEAVVEASVRQSQVTHVEEEAVPGKEGKQTSNAIEMDSAFNRELNSQPAHPVLSTPEKLVPQYLPPQPWQQRQFRLNQPQIASLPPVPVDSSQYRKSNLFDFELPAVFRKNKDKEKKPKKRDESGSKLRLYGASSTALTYMGGNEAIKIGGRAVWMKNSKLGLGLAGYAVQRPETLDALLSENYRLAGGYGGIHLEYTLNPTRTIHLSFPLLVAGGGLTYVQVNNTSSDPLRVNAAAEAVFVVEPGVLLELNLIKYVKVGFDLNYRYSSNSQLNYEEALGGGEIIDASGLNGLSFGATIKVGVF